MEDIAINYFNRLLNKSVDKNTLINLSSGQSARAHAWLTTNHFDVSKVNLRSGFTINSLLDGEQLNEQQAHSIQDIAHINTIELKTTFNKSIGIDIQSISELFPQGMSNDPKSESELLAIYTLNELSYAQSKPDPLQTLTGIFSAKEAILKCAQKTIPLNEVEVLPDASGKPSVVGFSLSISHSLDYAVAIAVQNPEEDHKEINIDSTTLSFGSIDESKIYKGNLTLDFIFIAITFILIGIETYLFLK